MQGGICRAGYADDAVAVASEYRLPDFPAGCPGGAVGLSHNSAGVIKKPERSVGGCKRAYLRIESRIQGCLGPSARGGVIGVA